MRFLMVIWADRGRAQAWERLTPAEQEVDGQPLHAWYEANAAAGRIRSGDETAWPRDRIAVGFSPVGPTVQHVAETTGSVLSGVMSIEVDTVETAIEMASTWPDLRNPGDRIDLIPIHNYDQP